MHHWNSPMHRIIKEIKKIKEILYLNLYEEILSFSLEKSIDGDRSQGQHEGCLFISYYTDI